MRKHFFLDEANATALQSFAAEVEHAGGTWKATHVPQSAPLEVPRSAGQLVVADWPDSAEAVTRIWETMRAARIAMDA